MSTFIIAMALITCVWFGTDGRTDSGEDGPGGGA